MFLKASTAYEFYVSAKDSAGNVTRTETLSLTTPPYATTFPNVAWSGQYPDEYERPTQSISGARRAVLSIDEPWRPGRITLFDADVLSGTFLLPEPLIQSYSGVSGIVLLNPECLVLWTWAHPWVHAHRYLITPTGAALTGHWTFGNSDQFAMNRFGDAKQLADGSSIGVWFDQHSKDSIRTMGYVRIPATVEPVLLNLQIPTPFTFESGWISTHAVAQHPADNTIWAFQKLDAASHIDAQVLSVNADGTLAVRELRTRFITTAETPGLPSDGINGPEGERPYLDAIASGNSIALCYQSGDWKWCRSTIWGGFPSSDSPEFDKAARPVICLVSSGGEKTFIPCPDYVERIGGLSLGSVPGGLQFVCAPLDPTTLAYDEVVIRSHVNGQWSAPTTLGPGCRSLPSVMAGRTLMQTPDGSVRLFDTPAIISTPPPPLTITPASVSLRANQQQQFTTDSTNPVTWSISPQVGTITQSGLYKSPSRIKGQRSVMVWATNGVSSGSAVVTLVK
jgi:hypothetical protein